MSDVELIELAKHFGGVVAVDGVSITVPSGTFAVLVGPSGCGKTTTLNMIAGLELPTAGRVIIAGKEVQDLPPHRRDIGMVFQSYALYPNRTVRGNIEFPLKVTGAPRRGRDARVSEVADLLGLEALLDRYPRALSGGQQQRVALARAIVKSPQLFLLDEPLSNLDAKLRAEMRFELKNIQRTLGATFILVTHDQAEALSLADVVIVMDRGRVQQVGSPDEVYGTPINTFVAGFVGVPAMNMTEGRVEGDRFIVNGLVIHLGGAERNGEAILGVRSEDFRISDSSEEGAFRAVIGLSELVGADRLTQLDSPLGRIVARTAASDTPPMGTSVSVTIASNGFHLFDASTGERIGANRELVPVAHQAHA